MTIATKLTSRYQTIATVGYTGSVGRSENRAAHGGVCLLQACRTASGQILARKVNSNGRHQEIGQSYTIDADQLAHWESISN